MHRVFILLLLFGSYALAEFASLQHSFGIPEKHIVVVTCSFNNKNFYQWNLDSIRGQLYTNWHLMYVEDNSPDGTDQLVREYIRANNLADKVIYIHNTDRQLALANLYRAIHMCKATDVIAILDGDDRFAYRQVLQRVNFAYENSNIWLTYGQFRIYGGHSLYCCQPYPQEIIAKGNFRSHPNTPSHLRTFYAGLFHKIDINDLKLDGKFFAMTYDLAMMFPMIEMARTHSLFISDILVDYNNTNPLNDHKVNKRLQQSIDQIIRGRPCYSEIASPF
jgi:glycosyltransferase involved in cell wall biosynthesis